MLFGGFALAVAGFIVPPTGQIHESVIGIFAECLIYAGSIFGVTIYIQTKYTELRSYLDNKLKEEEQKKPKNNNINQHEKSPDTPPLCICTVVQEHKDRHHILRKPE